MDEPQRRHPSWPLGVIQGCRQGERRHGAKYDNSSKGILMSKRKLVAVVDDDESVRESLPDLLRSFGFEVVAFGSAEEFLASESLARTACLVLDVAMPGMTGPDLQRALSDRRNAIPIVFITAYSDDKVLPRLLKSGAVACLIKPFTEAAILQAVTAALEAA